MNVEQNVQKITISVRKTYLLRCIIGSETFQKVANFIRS